jgi:hypothetical protein
LESIPDLDGIAGMHLRPTTMGTIVGIIQAIPTGTVVAHITLMVTIALHIMVEVVAPAIIPDMGMMTTMGAVDMEITIMAQGQRVIQDLHHEDFQLHLGLIRQPPKMLILM